MKTAENSGNSDDDQNIDDQQDGNTEGETLEGDDQQDGQGDGTGADDQDDEEVVVTVGEEAPPQEEEDHQPAPAWVKELRKADKEKARKIRELEAQLASKQTTETAAPVKLTRPTLADCDYNEEDFEKKLIEYNAQQQSAQLEQQQAENARKAADAAWQASVQSYETKKGALKVSDYDEREVVAKETLTITQQGIILTGAKNSAVVMYALGKNPEKLKEFAAITDPVKFCFAIAQWEPELKVTPRKAPPPPERSVRGGTTPPITNDAALKRLEDEAEKTGNRSKVIAYKAQLKAKAKAS